MKHVKSFALFENENWDLFEIQRMLDAGLMTPTEAAPAMRVVIRRLLAEAGTDQVWSAEGIAALREIPAVAAVGEPEAQPLWDAGFKPVSSIIQLAQGTLDWERIAEPADRDMTRRSIERLVFYEKTGYVRQMIGQALHVLFRSNPGGGLSFFKDKMRELNDRFAIDRQFVPSRKTVAAQERKEEAETGVETVLRDLFGETQADQFIDAYVQLASYGFSTAELTKLPQRIESVWPNLPIRYVQRGVGNLWQTLFDSMPYTNKLYLITSPIINPGFHWLQDWVNMWQAQVEAGKVNQRLSKPIRQTP